MSKHSRQNRVARPRVARPRLAAAARGATPAVVQPMERRVLMSAAVMSNGVLTVTGTAGADQIEVDTGAGKTNLYLDSVEQTLTGNLTSIVINAGDGNDTVSVDTEANDGSLSTTLTSIVVNGGAGDDQLTLFDYSAPATLDGGDGNDYLFGYYGATNAKRLTLTGDAGNDTISGSGGLTSINGGDGDDALSSEQFALCPVTVVGGAGIDTLGLIEAPTVTAALSVNLDGLDDSGTAANPSTLGADIENLNVYGSNVSVVGDALDNVISVNDVSGSATVHGGDGNDTLSVTGGLNNAIYGDAGNDTIIGGTGGPGVTTISGGAGTDTVDYSAQTTGVNVYLDGPQLSGTAANLANGYGDQLDGTTEIAIGGSGNDLLVAAPGGGDQLAGNGGNDTLVAQGGADALFGGDGNDTFNADDGGTTYIDGGAGTDTATIDATGDTTIRVETVTKAAPPAAVLANGVLTVTGTAGADTISVTNVANSTEIDVTVNGVGQTFASGVAHVVVNAGDGNDTVTVDNTLGYAGADYALNGQGGDDAISWTTDYGGQATLDGGDGNDGLVATNNMMSGLNAAATLLGGAGNDSLGIINSIRASLNGGDGNDQMGVNASYDLAAPVTVVGGAGTDSFGVTPSGSTVINLDGLPDSNLDGYTQSAGSEFGADIENVSVDAFDGGTTTIVGDALDNVLSVTNAQYGNVSLYGGAGNDTLSSTGYAQSNAVTSYLSGGAGNDRLTASGNSTAQNVFPATLSGGDGNDTLVSGGYATDLSGGAGTDTVDYSNQTAGLTVYLDGSHPSGSATFVAAGIGDTFDGTVEVVLGGSGADTIYANPAGGDALYGNGGNDTLVAQGGADALFGADGNDTFNAADGGATYIDGGAGTDTAAIDATGDTTVNVENVIKPTPTSTQLTGTTTGTAGSYQNNGNTVAKATDGNVNTYFDSPVANGDVVVVDLGSAKTVTQIKYAPRSTYASRMVGGVFQASNTADFSSGVVNVYTVTATPAVGVLTTVAPSTSTAYRYWRYVAPAGSYGNIAEFELFGAASSTPTPTPTQLTGTTSGTAGSYQSDGDTVAKATDGNLNTFFDGPTANGDVVTIDLDAAKSVAQIKYAPRSTYASRMIGGVFQASNSATFSSGVVNVYTVTATPAVGVLTAVTPTTTTAYRYWRYVAPAGSYGNIAEFQLFGATATTPTPTPTPTLTQRTGTTTGTAGSYQSNGNTVAKATDGSPSTYFDGPVASGDVVGLDLGSAQSVSQIKFAPRAGWESRMVGGVFQASNAADFSSGVVTLYTVAATPVAGSLTTVTLGSPATYRYFRYVAPANSYGNIAEFELFG